MKTIRLLYPDFVSGGLDTYYFGASLLSHILPPNADQPLVRVDVAPPGGEKDIRNGIYGLDDVLHSLRDAQKKIAQEKPDRIITIGGNCLVSLAPFDYLHGMYENTGILWVDAHPDVSTPENGYPYAHAMVLGSLLGFGARDLCSEMRNPPFEAKDVLYVGLQPIHGYQKAFLEERGLAYAIQDEKNIDDEEIDRFMRKYDHTLLHFDIDVLSEQLFHSTYFANKDLVGDGASGGRMTMETLGRILRKIVDNSDVVGFTIAEYLPFDEHNLSKMLSQLHILTE